MSGFSSIAVPGGIPTAGSGCLDITPEKLFRSNEEKDEYHKILSKSNNGVELKVKKAKVLIFDLSDQDQREEYEKLWAELIEKSSRMEVVVDSRKDLVHREDGTSYWMKYVEYVEFGDAKDDKQPHGGGNNS